ncbi:YjhT family mutarotase [Vibrio brasiliensis]|uniref:YjhT family mutarotase n=1 Tax=Vibrio brasiliensis TaxID=170652 RepID=UPI001EFD1728|nr:YjhT family mutarotase [Vibrio brasiliensis]MCG9782722.1 YjhT family mutarotase [Vibrio brasiliensis]
MSLLIDSFPALPVGIKNGIGGLLGTRLYVGLGSAGKQLFYYDLEQPESGWQQAADFPGTERNDACYVVSNDKLYVFSGAGKLPDGHAPVVLDDAYQFDAITNQWSKLSTTLPIGLLGASACGLSTGQLVFFGGYCKETFDSFVVRLSSVNVKAESEKHQSLLTEFMSRPVFGYGWNRDIWAYDLATNSWSVLAENPFAANCGAGIVQQGKTVTLIEGEIKPGLRSLQTKQFQFDSLTDITSNLCASIYDLDCQHEGLAGHYVGVIANQILAVGGAYFVGSQRNFNNKQWYSHQGLSKHYSNSIWRFDGKAWYRERALPQGVAYGVAISADNRIYILGGENKFGIAQTRCYVLS